MSLCFPYFIWQLDLGDVEIEGHLRHSEDIVGEGDLKSNNRKEGP